MIAQHECLYCGRTNVEMTDEHIFPEALGGREVLENAVCKDCNNGILSLLDRELITQSPLSLIAFRELKTGLPGTWDIDESSDNIPISAEPIIDGKVFDAMWVWPQLVLENSQLSLRGNQREVDEIGREKYNKIVLTHARKLVNRYNRGHKSLIFKQHLQEEFRKGQKYPPRIYLPHKIRDLKRNSKMIVSYVTDDDKDRLLAALNKLSDDFTFARSVVIPGAKRPLITRIWYPNTIVRALGKIAINLLVHLCEKTPVNLRTFPAINYITGRYRKRKESMPPFGFILPDDAKEIHHPEKGHAAMIVYDDSIWTIVFSFFGGELAAVVKIPGLSSEDWKTSYVSMALNNKNSWKADKYVIYRELRCHVEWEDPNKICPALREMGNWPKVSYEQIPAARSV